MSRVLSFAGFWWAFLVGDDWRLTVGILLGLAATVLLNHAGIPAWWPLPAAVTLVLAKSLQRATRQCDG